MADPRGSFSWMIAVNISGVPYPHAEVREALTPV